MKSPKAQYTHVRFWIGMVGKCFNVLICGKRMEYKSNADNTTNRKRVGNYWKKH